MIKLIKENEYFDVHADYEKSNKTIYIYFRKKIIEDGWASTELYSEKTYKIRWKTFSRRSQKQISIADKFIESNINQLFALWTEGKTEELIGLIRGTKK